MEFEAGHWVEAETALREAIDLYRQINAAAGEALGLQRLGVLQTARGELAEGLATLEDGVIAAKNALLRSHMLGRLHAAIAHNRLLAGDLPAADHALALGLSLIQGHGHCTICESLLLPLGVSIRLAQDNVAAAEAYFAEIEEAVVRFDSRTWRATAARSRGELAAARGDTAQALACYQEAHDGFKAARNEVEARQCLELMARLEERQPLV